MLRNYIKIAWRNLSRDRNYMVINIAGLAIGIAACLLIFLTIRFETSFDNFHKDSKNIYRVSGYFKNQDGIGYTMGSAYPLARILRTDFPQLKKVAAIYAMFGIQVTVTDSSVGEQKKFLEDGVFFAEPEFFDIFNFPLIAGSHSTALKEPGTVIMTRSMAEKYFGNWQSAMGKTVRVGTRTVCKVTGVLADPPVNTDFPLKIVLSFLSNRNAGSTDWITSNSDLNTYVVLPDGRDTSSFNQALQQFVVKHKPPEYVKDGYVLQSMSTVHSDAKFGNYNSHTFSNRLISALSLVGIFLLIIACVNFINLATARAIKRAKEVGVRKVLGGQRKQLISQFLTETFLISLLAIVAALGLAFMCLPLLNQLLSIAVDIHFDLPLIAFLLILLMSVTVLSGFYPAIILSGFSPITALKDRMSSSSSLVLRKALVVLQFAIAQTLIIGTLIIISQMDFFMKADMGFNKEAVVTIPLPADSLSRTKIDGFKNDLLRQPGIEKVAFSNYVPSEDSHWEIDFRFNNATERTNFTTDLKFGDLDYVKLYDLKLVTGRFYHPSDTVREVVVNESLLTKFGISSAEEALGKTISFLDPEITVPIVGVIKDFHSYSLEKPIAPVILAPRKANYTLGNIKLSTAEAGSALTAIEKLWKNAFPNSVYKFQFLDDKIAGYYKQELRMASLYRVFAAIAILISCLGLYGLIAFMAEQRKKEIGIRKVLGASTGNIMLIFSREFAWLMIIAFFIAAPVAWYFMNSWLQQYTYRINIGVGIFLLTLTISALIILLSIGYRTLRAATTNPVSNLRAE